MMTDNRSTAGTRDDAPESVVGCLSIIICSVSALYLLLSFFSSVYFLQFLLHASAYELISELPFYIVADAYFLFTFLSTWSAFSVRVSVGFGVPFTLIFLIWAGIVLGIKNNGTVFGALIAFALLWTVVQVIKVRNGNRSSRLDREEQAEPTSMS